MTLCHQIQTLTQQIFCRYLEIFGNDYDYVVTHIFHFAILVILAVMKSVTSLCVAAFIFAF